LLSLGVLAGGAGTAAMDVLWYLRYKSGGGTERFTDWEFPRKGPQRPPGVRIDDVSGLPDPRRPSSGGGRVERRNPCR